MYVYSDFDENTVIKNISLISMDPNHAFLVDKVLLMRSLARGCSAVGKVTGLSY